MSQDDTSLGTGLFCPGNSPIQNAVEVMLSFHGYNVRSTGAFEVLFGGTTRIPEGITTRGVDCASADVGQAKRINTASHVVLRKSEYGKK
jgi:hypothetical protein